MANVLLSAGGIIFCLEQTDMRLSERVRNLDYFRPKDLADEIAQLEARRDALLEALKYADDCYIAAEVEGLDEAVDSTIDARLKDLLTRRLAYAFSGIRAAIAAEGERR